MIKHGTLFTCDRCGETKFVEVETVVGVTSADIGWGYHDGHQLCPTCTELYNKMMNSFFAPEVKRAVNLEV